MNESNDKKHRVWGCLKAAVALLLIVAGVWGYTHPQDEQLVKEYKTWIIVDDDEPFYKYFKGTGTHTWKMYDSAMKKGHVYHFTIAAVGKNYTFIKSKKVTMKIK